jgi:hypothetical protein
VNTRVFINHMKISLYDDLGVNVDKQFTKNRVLTNAVKFLLFYVYSQVVTDTFAHWRVQAAKLQKLRIKRAGWLLTRVALGLLGRRKVRLIRENKERQALVEEKLRKKEGKSQALVSVGYDSAFEKMGDGGTQKVALFQEQGGYENPEGRPRYCWKTACSNCPRHFQYQNLQSLEDSMRI